MDISKAARGRITGPFGAINQLNSHVPVHMGVDLGHGDGTDEDRRVIAPADGVVTQASWYGTYGNRVQIDHGRDGGGVRWESLLAHLEWFTVSVGDRVKRGQTIARMGNTGTKFVHLHQELRRNGVQIDPVPHFTTPEEDMPLNEADKAWLRQMVQDEVEAKALPIRQRAEAARDRATEARDTAQRGIDAVKSLGITLVGAISGALAQLTEIGTREGKAGRTYGDLETRRVVYISERSVKWRDLTHEQDPEGVVRKLASLGWAQRDIKWLSRADFEDAMREANRTIFQSLNPLPWYLIGEADPGKKDF